MSSLRDAIRRLQVIKEACVPEQSDNSNEGGDDFTRSKRKIHKDCKEARQLLKEREDMMGRAGNDALVAEASYRIRHFLKSIREEIDKMSTFISKEEKRKFGKKLEAEDIAKRKEVLELCRQHLNELEDLDKRRFAEKFEGDRSELLKLEGNGGRTANVAGPEMKESGNRKALFEGATGKKKRKGAKENDPFQSNLPEIDDDDFKAMKEKDKMINEDMEEIGKGVSQLKEIAINMGKELDHQNDQLVDLEKNVDKAMDNLDNVNVKMKKVLDGVMKGDRFMLNCILMCIILALIAFVANLFF